MRFQTEEDPFMKKLAANLIIMMTPLLAFGGQQTIGQSDTVKKKPILETFANYQFSGFEASNSIKLGSGNGFEGGVRYFPDPMSRWGLGFRIGKLSHDIEYDHPMPIEGPDAVSVEGNAWTAIGDAYIRARGDKIQPYLVFGLGYLRKHHTYYFQSGQSNTKDRSNLVIDIGGGLNIAVTDRLSFAPQIGFMWSNYYFASQAGVSVTYKIFN